MNKTYGLLMSGEIIRAYKDRLKSETRRTRGLDVVNEAPDQWKFVGFNDSGIATFQEVGIPGDTPTFVHYRAPYGWVGEDTLWFKETWKMYEREEDGRDFLHYRADDEKVDPTWWTKEDWTRPDPIWHKKNVFEKWQSSMLMPKLCCRFTNIPILDVKVERLKDMSFMDAANEGCPRELEIIPGTSTPVTWYFELWDKLNGDKLPAHVDPWVWVYKFPKVVVVNHWFR